MKNDKKNELDILLDNWTKSIDLKKTFTQIVTFIFYLR